MNKILIFGNSGAGKSTLAKNLVRQYDIAHLDLDLIAWLPVVPLERKPLAESQKEIESFINQNSGWVIEGCYSDLLKMAIPDSTEIVFLNLTVETCINNAKHRPWEPHKYVSKERQDANLNMLINWISEYYQREDTFSKTAHLELFESYPGRKTMQESNKLKL